MDLQQYALDLADKALAKRDLSVSEILFKVSDVLTEKRRLDLKYFSGINPEPPQVNIVKKIKRDCSLQNKTKRVSSNHPPMSGKDEKEEEYIPRINKIRLAIKDCSETENIEEKNKIKKYPKLKRNKNDAPKVIRAMPEGFKEKISTIIKGNVSEDSIKLLIQKKLTSSDLDGGLNRLSMPVKQMQQGVDFLSEKEKDFLHDYEKGKPVNTMDVKVIDPSGEVNDLLFCRWVMGKGCEKAPSILYVLKGKWYDLVASKEHNGLIEDVEVQLWSFRVDNKLQFALIKL